MCACVYVDGKQKQTKQRQLVSVMGDYFQKKNQLSITKDNCNNNKTK